MNWQPIETAPTDGTRILVANGDQGAWHIEIVGWRLLHSGTEGWGPDDGESVYAGGWFAPSYWMPLPPPQ